MREHGDQIDRSGEIWSFSEKNYQKCKFDGLAVIKTAMFKGRKAVCVLGILLFYLGISLHAAEVPLYVGSWTIIADVPGGGAPAKLKSISYMGVHVLAEGRSDFPYLKNISSNDDAIVNVLGQWETVDVENGNTFVLGHSSGATGRMIFSASEQTILGKSWHYLKYKYIINREEGLAEVFDMLFFALNNGTQSLEVAMQRDISGYQYYGWMNANYSDTLSVGSKPVYAAAQPWDAQFSNAKLMVRWPEVGDTTVFSRLEKSANSVGVRYKDRWAYGTRREEIETSNIVIALAGNAIKDDWINFARYRSKEINQAYGLSMPERPLPWAIVHKKVFTTSYPRGNLYQLTSYFPRAEYANVSRFQSDDGLWQCNASDDVGTKSPLAIRSITVPAVAGGEDALEAITQDCLNRGMVFCAWYPLALSTLSSLMAQYDWQLWNIDGTPFTSGYSDITGCNQHEGFDDYLYDRMSYHYNLNLSSIWWDSYTTFGPAVPYREQNGCGELPQLLEMTADFRALGVETLLEGIGPLGLSAMWLETANINTFPAGYERWMFDIAPVLVERVNGQFVSYVPSYTQYFTYLANRCTPAIDYTILPDGDLDSYARLNAIYPEIIDTMQISHPDPLSGVRMWANDADDMRILFSISGNGNVSVPAGYTLARELISYQTVPVTNGQLAVQPLKVYRICKP